MRPIEVAARDLRTLLDENAAAAVDRARRLDVPEASIAEVDYVRAAVLIDGGTSANDIRAIEEGVGILRSLMSASPKILDVEYNLANGLIALAGSPKGHDWYARTADLRREARELYWKVRCESRNLTIQTQALTNLGNALDRAGRWVEALDMYVEALSINPTNGMAAGCASELLAFWAGSGVPDARHFAILAARYARRAQENEAVVREFGGHHAVERFRILGTDDADTTLPIMAPADEYQHFVVQEHLTLSPLVEGLADPRRWDSLTIARLTEPIETRAVPPVFAMFNSMKADFLLARRIAWDGMATDEDDSGLYIDTLDYARYGPKAAKLSLAHRTAVDLLDKIAVAVNHYLGLGLEANKIYFRNLWKEAKTSRLRPRLEDEQQKRNFLVTALSELADDLAHGYLSHRQRLRHAATHRFIVLHEPFVGEFREDSAIEHFTEEKFAAETIEVLKMVRSALIYFVHLVYLREARESTGLSIPLELRLQHEFRQEST